MRPGTRDSWLTLNAFQDHHRTVRGRCRYSNDDGCNTKTRTDYTRRYAYLSDHRLRVILLCLFFPGFHVHWMSQDVDMQTGMVELIEEEQFLPLVQALNDVAVREGLQEVSITGERMRTSHCYRRWCP